MKKYFANYNQSLALKELGFDEPCFAYYTHNEKLCRYGSNDISVDFLLCTQKDIYKTYLLVPLKSQVFEWFRKEHNLKGFVEPVEYFDDTPETYMWVVYNDCHSGTEQLTFEEAESACIDKLIEIVQNGSKINII